MCLVPPGDLGVILMEDTSDRAGDADSRECPGALKNVWLYLPLAAIGVRVQLSWASGRSPQGSWTVVSNLDPPPLAGFTITLAARPESSTLRRGDSSGNRPPLPESSMGVAGRGELELTITPGNTGVLLLLLEFIFVQFSPPSSPAEIAGHACAVAVHEFH